MKKEKRTMDIVLKVIAVILTLFTISMIITYWHVGGVPDVLITAVFGACLGEFGFMAWIKNTKERYSNGSDDGFTGSSRNTDRFGDGSNQEDDWRQV